jgi:hypothetical protein
VMQRKDTKGTIPSSPSGLNHKCAGGPRAAPCPSEAMCLRKRPRVSQRCQTGYHRVVKPALGTT